MIKIKRHKKVCSINEAGAGAPNTWQINTNRDESIQRLFDQILDQKRIDLQKVYAINMSDMNLNIPISEINRPINLEIVNEKGETETVNIIPAQLVAKLEQYIANARHMTGVGTILSYIDRPIIWTIDSNMVPTAASDGIRVAFNLAFAYKLLASGIADLRQQLQTRSSKNLSKDFEVSKRIIFILLHEVYHQIYRHREAEAQKAETANGQEHELANISQDVEINRDIERQLTDFRGITNAIGGCFDARFPRETWEQIFDAYFYNRVDNPPGYPNAPKVFDQKLTPKSAKESNRTDNPTPPQRHDPDYINGRDTAIQDVLDQKVDPLNCPPSSTGNDLYDQGYNDAIEEIKQGLTDGIEYSTKSQEGQSSDLSQVPWDIMQKQQNRGSSDNSDDTSDQGQQGGSGQSSNNQNRQGGSGDDSDDMGDQGQQGGSGQSSNNQNQQGNNQNQQGGGSGSGDMNQQGQQDGSGAGGSDDMGQQGGSGAGGSGAGGSGAGGSGAGGSDDMGQQGGSGQSSNNQNRQGGSGAGGSDDMGQQGGNPGISDLSDKSDAYKKAYEDELRRQLDKTMGNDIDEIDPSSETIEEGEARAQAREDLKKALKKIEQELESKKGKIDIDEISAGLEGSTVAVGVTSGIGMDLISKNEMAEIAKQSGVTYTAADATSDPIEKAKSWTNKNIDALSKIEGLVNKLNDIADKLKTMPSLVPWKPKLKKIFRNIMQGGIEDVRSRRLMGQSNRSDRYQPYKDQIKQEFHGADAFYLIDNSGSMYSNGNDVFYQIFKEIITIEKQCKVNMSARAYFTTGIIRKEDVEMWTSKTPKDTVLSKLGDRGGSGGTEIAKNVVSVTQLKKPLYYQIPGKHTTIFVFTDGEEYGDWSELNQIPAKIKKDIVFIIINTKTYLTDHVLPSLLARGIKLSNILGIDIHEYQ